MAFLPIPIIVRSLCTRCGLCVERCPTNSLELVDGFPVVARADACEYTGLCEEVCPTGAIELPYLIEFGDEPPIASG